MRFSLNHIIIIIIELDYILVLDSNNITNSHQLIRPLLRGWLVTLSLYFMISFLFYACKSSSFSLKLACSVGGVLAVASSYSFANKIIGLARGRWLLLTSRDRQTDRQTVILIAQLPLFYSNDLLSD